MRRIKFCVFCLVIGLVLSIQTASAQTTAFNYQGSLKSGGNPANGNFDFEFALFDAVSGGPQVGSTISANSVAVSNGIFNVSLNFGSLFPGANRFLEIGVRQTGGGAFTVLTPRQSVNSSPYSIKSLLSETTNNALSLGGIAANQYVTTTNGGANFIQNSTSQQASSNFNISGNGNADRFNAATQYDLGGSRILSNSGTDNLFAGVNAGAANSTGFQNSFFGSLSGSLNTTGFNNAFFGSGAGFINSAGNNNSFFGSSSGSSNTTGNQNAFFGSSSGNANSTGSANSFFGANAGRLNNSGTNNSFFGVNAGELNTFGGFNAFFGNNAGAANDNGNRNTFVGVTAGRDNIGGSDNTFVGGAAGQRNTSGGDNSFFGSVAGAFNSTGTFNSFFGRSSGSANTQGHSNAFFGWLSGSTNVTGNNNTLIGSTANVAVDGLTFATAIGGGAVVAQSNSLVLGRINGVGGATADTNVGIGTTAPAQTLHVNGSEILSTGSESGFKFRTRGSFSNGDDWVWYATGVPGTARFFKVGTGDILTIQPTGEFAVNFLGSAGTVGLCRNASNQISTCSSSLRYKTNINQFGSGLDLISRLRPVSFNWLANNQFDFGLVAEEVAEIEPLLVSYNDKGEIEGVKYDRLGVVLINAVGEQQKQIEAQNEIIRRQQTELDSMKNFLCSQYPTAEFCQSK